MSGADQKPELLQITILDATDRRAYEVELLLARWQAEKDQGRVREFAPPAASRLPTITSRPRSTM